MAIAETADLAVRLSLDDKRFIDPLNRIDRRLGAFSGAVNRNLGRAFDTAIQRGARALFGNINAGLDTLRELEVITTQTNAVIESTGGVAGVTAEQVRNLAEKYEGLNATIDDKVIQSAENLLLTFKNVQGEAFEPALQAALDMSTALGKDLVPTMQQLGKALDDPEKGLSRLERATGGFSDATREAIKVALENNDTLEAQRLILAELETKYGGSFAKNADTASAKQAKFRDAIEDTQAALATGLLPVVTRVGERITAYLTKPETIAFFKEMGETIGALASDENLDTLTTGIKTAADAVGVAIKAFNTLPPEIKALAIGAFAVNKVTGGAVTGAAEAVGKIIGAGLKTVFAANVTVVGKNVIGGGGQPVPGGGGGGGKGGGSNFVNKLGRVLEVASKIAIVGFVAELAETLEDPLADLAHEIRDGLGINKFWDTIGIPELRPQDLQWPFGPKNTPTILPGFMGSKNGILGGEGQAPARNRGTIEAGAGRTRGGDWQPVTKSITRLESRLDKAIREEQRATRQGDRQNAREAGQKVDRLRERLASKLGNIDQTTKQEGNQTQNAEQKSLVAFRAGERATERVGSKLNTSNARLGTIARKDMSVKVNVSSAVSVATYVRGVAVSTRYGNNNNVTAI